MQPQCVGEGEEGQARWGDWGTFQSFSASHREGRLGCGCQAFWAPPPGKYTSSRRYLFRDAGTTPENPGWYMGCFACSISQTNSIFDLDQSHPPEAIRGGPHKRCRYLEAICVIVSVSLRYVLAWFCSPVIPLDGWGLFLGKRLAAIFCSPSVSHPTPSAA